MPWQIITGDSVNGGGAMNLNEVASSVHRTQANTLTTTVTNDPNVFVQVSVNSLDPVTPEYAGDFEQGGVNEASLVHLGGDHDYMLQVSGSVISLNPDFLGSYIGVKLISDLQGEFTGGVKFYPIGVSFGSSPAMGFQVTVFGRFPENDTVRLQLSSNNAGDLSVVDCIYYAQRIVPEST